MDAPLRRVHPFLAVALVLAVVGGYLLGGRHQSVVSSSADSLPSAARSVSTAGLLIEYPDTWRTVAAYGVPGLALKGATTVAPSGRPVEGLVAGSLPAGLPAPLPAAFLARLPAPPRAEVVDLTATQAYRYGDVTPRGYSGSLDIYAIPATSGATRLLVCFARQRLTPTAQLCERTVSAVTPIGLQTPSLTPEPGYARALSSIVRSVQSARTSARSKMASTRSTALVAQLAAGLSAKLSSAAASVTALPGPALVATAATNLAATLRQAARAYTALSYASTAERLSAYEAARAEVTAAEHRIDGALESFTLLGYGPAPAG